ncbi:hypothetical protein O5264_29845, partial [Escherichia coli]|nr:hypothetical protein [Escherichia coli]
LKRIRYVDEEAVSIEGYNRLKGAGKYRTPRRFLRTEKLDKVGFCFTITLTQDVGISAMR